MSLIIEKKGSTGCLTFNRPNVLNALDKETLRKLWSAWADFGDDPDVWSILITGAGDRAFCVGRDLKSKEALDITGLFESFHEFTIGHAAKLDKPVIVAVNGYALGWGLTIALLADIRLASENASFGFPEVKRGLLTGVGSLLLPKSVSWCNAMYILLTGETIDAHEAYRIGLVNKVLPRDELLPYAEQISQKICDNAPLALRATKQIARMGLELPTENARQIVEWMRYTVKHSDDASEGLLAFAEKRRPHYKGR
jgi:enoyl-CoA hydratase/carnithine racemase